MLHIVKKSPFETSSLNDAMKYMRAGDAMLLIEDGVYAAKKGTKYGTALEGISGNNEVYCLLADVKARGILETELAAGVKLIDYKGFVDKVIEHNPLTWA